MKRNKLPDPTPPTAGQIFAMVEDRILSGNLVLPAFHYLNAFAVPKEIATEVLGRVRMLLDEATEAMDAPDAPIGKRALAARVKFLEKVVGDFERYVGKET